MKILSAILSFDYYFALTPFPSFPPSLFPSFLLSFFSFFSFFLSAIFLIQILGAPGAQLLHLLPLKRWPASVTPSLTAVSLPARVPSGLRPCRWSHLCRPSLCLVTAAVRTGGQAVPRADQAGAQMFRLFLQLVLLLLFIYVFSFSYLTGWTRHPYVCRQNTPEHTW